MNSLYNLLIGISGGLFFILLSSFVVRARRAREYVAAKRAFIILLVMVGIFSVFFFLPLPYKEIFLLVLGTFLLIFLVLLLLPIGRVEVKKEIPIERYDERDIPFSRFRLEPGTEAFNEYYLKHPELKEKDDRIRRLPGLLSLKGREAHPLAFASSMASFQFIKDQRYRVDGDTMEALPEYREAVSDYSPAELSDWLKKLAKFYGARSSGITKLEKYHMYSHIGRGTGKYGSKIDLPHSYAIAFTVEMRNDFIQQGPGAVSVMESAREYALIAHIALQLTHFIRALGYSARSHIDENYRVICPLVARDAGLGEVGRMGFLITPDLGPRVRIAVVTTDMKLVPDEYVPDASVIDFCNFCLKCAVSCPVSAIPKGDRELIRGALKWQIDPVACFKFWNLSGTDCGRCMAVCPYSHIPLYSPGIVKFLVKKSGFARRAILRLDDFLYGKKPKPYRGVYIGN